MTIEAYPDHHTIAHHAAHKIAKEINEKNQKGECFVLGLATGATMDPVYAELIKLCQTGDVSFQNVKFFNLDNYIGLKADDINSYDTQLKERFLSRIDAKPENIDLVSSDPNFNLELYEERIRACGGIDVQLVGTGRKGHIGFNEVGSATDSKSRKVQLCPETLEDNSKYFNRIDEETKKSESIPLTAHTRGIAPILEAKKILCLANGHAKALALKEYLTPTPVETLPARALHTHPNMEMMVDYEALALFNEAQLSTNTDLSPEGISKVISSNQPYYLELIINRQSKSLLLPPQFDFYDPNHMAQDEAFDPGNEKHRDLLAKALEATQNLVLGAHPDDAEIMAGPMMIEASSTSPWLNIIVTNGAAANNTLKGDFAKLSVDELTQLRQQEQRKSAFVTKTPVIMLKLPSPAISGYMGQSVLANANQTVTDLISAMPALRDTYSHNPFDEHDTHVFSLIMLVQALRQLAKEQLNQIKVFAMEVWGSFNVASHRDMKFVVTALETMQKWLESIGVYESQIASQKRNYAEATIDRAKGHTGFKTSPYSASPPLGLLSGINISDLVHNPYLPVLSMPEVLTQERQEQDNDRQKRLSRYLSSKRGFEQTLENTQLSSSSFFDESTDLPNKVIKVCDKNVTAENHSI